MKYKANIEGIRAVFVATLSEYEGWDDKTYEDKPPWVLMNEATNEFFAGLDKEGVVHEYKVTTMLVRKEEQFGYLVEVDCLFPEDCETDQLTFAHVVPG